jgi:hypothetical protein
VERGGVMESDERESPSSRRVDNLFVTGDPREPDSVMVEMVQEETPRDRNAPVLISVEEIFYIRHGIGDSGNVMVVQSDVDNDDRVRINVGCWNDAFTRAEIDTIILLLEKAREAYL